MVDISIDNMDSCMAVLSINNISRRLLLLEPSISSRELTIILLHAQHLGLCILDRARQIHQLKVRWKQHFLTSNLALDESGMDPLPYSKSFSGSWGSGQLH